MFRRLIAHAARRTPYERKFRVVTFQDVPLFKRFCLFWQDEFEGRHRPPWWRPFNILLHWWNPGEGISEEFHDHPRWSITICLQGRLVERTPWSERLLKPGSVVIRSRRAIHAFHIPEGYSRKTWTLFIVGRRNHPQTVYTLTRH